MLSTFKRASFLFIVFQYALMCLSINSGHRWVIRRVLRFPAEYLSRLPHFLSPTYRMSSSPSFDGYDRASVINNDANESLLSQFPVVILAKGKARLFQDGNPIIYGGAIAKITGDPAIGAEVLVKDSNENPLGRGLFNPVSTYRVRLLARSYESIYSAPLSEILRVRLSAAIDLRSHLQLPLEGTNTVYRLGKFLF